MSRTTTRTVSQRRFLVRASAVLGMAGLAVTASIAPAQSDRGTAQAEVRAVMEGYITASRNSDEQMARGLFHPNAIMTGAQEGGKMNFGTPESFFRSLAKTAAAPSKPSYGPARVVQVTVAGEIATGTVEESDFHGKRYTDMFQLIHHEGRWLIISKTYYGMPTQ